MQIFELTSEPKPLMCALMGDEVGILFGEIS